MYGNVCTASNWWVTTAIDVIFVMILLAVTLWIVKLCTGIYANWSSAKAKSQVYFSILVKYYFTDSMSLQI